MKSILFFTLTLLVVGGLNASDILIYQGRLVDAVQASLVLNYIFKL